jgi:uncharacterized protein (DUF1501 family)
MLSRRRFILQGSSLISLSPLVPSMLCRAARAAAVEPDGRVLVVVQLDGGNDGLNTVVPYADDAYARARPKLKVNAKEVHKLDDRVGLNPRMQGAKALFDDGRLAVVQGVGYPNPDRSHFRSMRIWQTASMDSDDHNNYGWLGRALDEQKHNAAATQPNAIYVGPEDAPVSLWGRRSEVMTVTNLDGLNLPYSADQLSPAQHGLAASGTADDALRLFTTQQVLSAYTTADQFQRQIRSTRDQSSSKYPDSELAAHLKMISQLIKCGSSARVFYASHGGYDTHAAQLFTHAGLLNTLSEALKAFLNDLKSAHLDDRVVVLAFSEFGRRVKENDSQGTDHGAAAPVFLAGGKTAGGLVGMAPDLADLDNGDVKMNVDLRSIYAALLDDWLGVDSSKVLAHSFAKAKVLRA